MKHGLRELGLTLVLLTLIGCGNTADGMKKDAEINSDKTSRAAEDVGAKALETGNDMSAAMTLTPAVKKAFQDDASMASAVSNIDVDSTEEKVVLNGAVTSEEQKSKAEEIAKKIIKERNGKQSVENNLKVQ